MCGRFNQYIYGRKDDVQSDHKLPETTFTKLLITIPKGFQGMLLCLHKLSLWFHYKKEFEIFLADLYRAPARRIGPHVYRLDLENYYSAEVLTNTNDCTQNIINYDALR